MSRLSPLEPATLDAEARAVYDAIVAGPRGEVVGPLTAWLRSPGFADKAQALGQYARYDSRLPPILSELAILVTARIWSSGFEWAHHAPIAAEAGLAEDAIDAIAQGRRPVFTDTAQRAVFDFALALHRERAVPEPAFAAARAALSEAGVVDLVGICGYYGLISMTINAFDIPDGDGPALPSLNTPPETWFQD